MFGSFSLVQLGSPLFTFPTRSTRLNSNDILTFQHRFLANRVLRQQQVQVFVNNAQYGTSVFVTKVGLGNHSAVSVFILQLEAEPRVLIDTGTVVFPQLRSVMCSSEKSSIDMRTRTN